MSQHHISRWAISTQTRVYLWLTECSKNFKPSITCAQRLLKYQTLILQTPLSRMVRFCWGMLGLVSNPTRIKFWNQSSFNCNFDVWAVVKLCYFVSCSGEPDATSIQWKVLKLNELTPCACGSYYLLKRGNPTKLDLGDPEADHHH